MLAGRLRSRVDRPQATMMATVSSPSTGVASPGAAMNARSVCQLATTTCSSSPGGAPRNPGSCWRKMITAIPLVNPVITG